MYGDAAANCDAPSISSKSFKASSWAWPGLFDFNSLDASLSAFYACANAAAVSVSLDTQILKLNVIQKFMFTF